MGIGEQSKFTVILESLGRENSFRGTIKIRSAKIRFKKPPTMGIAAVAPAPEVLDAKCTLGCSKGVGQLG